MSNLIIIAIIIERIVLAVIGLLAAIYDQVWWSIFMATILIVLIANTTIKIHGGEE